MADVCDLTQETQEFLEAVRAKQANQPIIRGPAYCQDCSEPMIEVRRAHGFQICITCAEIKESALGSWRRTIKR